MKIFLQKLLYAVLLGFAGFGMYSGWTMAQVFIEGLEQDKPAVVVKKISPVKPKFFHNRIDGLKVTQVKDEFTFFDTLNDPSMTKIIGLDGTYLPQKEPEIELPLLRFAPSEEVELIDTARPTSIQPVRFSAALQDEKKIPGPVPTERIRTPEPPVGIQKSAPPERKAPFSLQVSSFRDRRYAEALQARLEKKGYPSFVTRKQLRGGRIWYRVFIGHYADRGSALAAAEKIRQAEPFKPMVVRQSG